MLTGHTWVAIQYRLVLLPKGKTIEYGRAGRRPLCGGSGTVNNHLSARARKDLNPPRHHGDCRLGRRNNRRWVVLGCRRGFHGEERRHPPLNIRRSCSAVSAPIRQAGAPPPPMGMRERFQNQIPFNVTEGRADQPFSETAARRRGN